MLMSLCRFTQECHPIGFRHELTDRVQPVTPDVRVSNARDVSSSSGAGSCAVGIA